LTAPPAAGGSARRRVLPVRAGVARRGRRLCRCRRGRRRRRGGRWRRGRRRGGRRRLVRLLLEEVVEPGRRSDGGVLLGPDVGLWLLHGGGGLLTRRDLLGRRRRGRVVADRRAHRGRGAERVVRGRDGDVDRVLRGDDGLLCARDRGIW